MDENKIDPEEFLSKMETPFKGSNEFSWQAIQDKINESEVPVYSLLDYKKKRINYGLVAGLTLLVSLTLFFVFKSDSSQFYSSSEKDIILPDSSTAFLFKNATLNYKEDSNERRLSLEGGAIFKVKSGNPFIVETKLGSVEVLGTVFSVDAIGECLIVKCVEGSVKVRWAENAQIVKNGQGILINKKSHKAFTINALELTERENGRLFFNKIPLSNVLKQLENEFDIQVQSDIDAQKLLYTGNFSNTNLSEALDLIAVPMSLKYEINGNKVKFYQ